MMASHFLKDKVQSPEHVEQNISQTVPRLPFHPHLLSCLPQPVL